MPAPSYTYTLTNGTTADATQVQQNFTDILNGVSDGTKDLSINALTVAGALTANGNVTLGNASGDDVTVTGSLASHLVPKTDATYDLGSSSIFHRAIYTRSAKITGSSDETQARLIGNGTQTNPILLVEKSDGTDLLKIFNTTGTAIRGTTGSDTADAGYVGEKISATLAGASTATADTEVFDAGTMSLTAGQWMIFYGAILVYGPGGSLGASEVNVYGRLRVYNETAGTAVSGSAIFHGEALVQTSLSRYKWVESAVVVNISATSTFKLGLTCNKTSNSTGAQIDLRAADLGVFTGADNESVFYAVRMR
jgi:hypothetical protein